MLFMVKKLSNPNQLWQKMLNNHNAFGKHVLQGHKKQPWVLPDYLRFYSWKESTTNPKKFKLATFSS